jgi:hypothetical protein
MLSTTFTHERCTRLKFALAWAVPKQDEGTARVLRLAEYVNVPVYIVHVMSGGAVREIAAAKTRGVRVIGEAIASGFGSEEGKVWDPDFKVRLPPRCFAYLIHFVMKGDVLSCLSFCRQLIVCANTC